MGKHAAPRTSPFRGRTAQRAAAVSAGTVVLCLGAAAPALATTALPTPPPVPQPIADAVQQVSNVAGIADPIGSSSTTKPHHHRQGTHPAKTPVLSDQTQVTPISRPSTKPATPRYTPASYSVAGLRGVPLTSAAAIAGRAPAMAGQQSPTLIRPAAGSSPLSAALQALPPTEDTGRILLVALAVMVLGGLTSGHIKVAQQRVLSW